MSDDDRVRGVRGAQPSITLAALAEGAPNESRPALLALARAHADRSPGTLLRQWQRDGFVAPSPMDQRTALAFDQMALTAADGYEALLLSPVAPLGACSAVALTSQDRTLSAHRSTEVVSDPTNALALECAARLARSDGDVALCTVHQVLRAQRFEGEGRTQHFRMFALADAGRARASDGFVVDAFVRQVGVQCALVRAARDVGHPVGALRLRAYGAPDAEVLCDRVCDALDGVAPIARASLDSAYYDGVKVMLDAERDGTWHNLGDVGRFDWVAQLASNRKVRFVASGFGLQLLPLLFPAAPTP